MTEENTSNKAYLALARKYRPLKFSEIIGQDTLVKVLSNAILKNRIHHAYLFSGARGVGKTTTARIFASAINCENLHSGIIEPCGICKSCIDIVANKHIDVIEFDAASHTSVENIRDLIDSVPYRPAAAKYKVYIIDEIHMLSEKAFNALLKTLEEPPAYVVFIFATTELRQIPATILSRCIQFDLKLVSRKDLSTGLNFIAKAEGFTLEEDALDTLVAGAQGSVRDSQSLLDQSLTLAENGVITGMAVRSMLGIGSKENLFSLLNILLVGNISEALILKETMIVGGSDPALLIVDLMEIINSVTESTINNEIILNSSRSENDKTNIKLLSSKLTVEKGLIIWQILQKGYQEILWSPLPSQTLSMIMIKLAYASQLPSIEPYLESLLSKKPVQLETSSVKLNESINKQATKHIIENKEIEPIPSVNNNILIFNSFKELTKYAKEKQRIKLTRALESQMTIINYKPGNLVVYVKDNVQKHFIKNTISELNSLTGDNWIINVEKLEINSELDKSNMPKTISEDRSEQFNSLLQEFKSKDYVKDIEEKSNFKLVNVSVEDK